MTERSHDRIVIEVEAQDSFCVVRIKGRLAIGTDLEFVHAKTDEIKACKFSRVLVDLHEAAYIDSTLIGFLVNIYTSVSKATGGRFVMIGANERVLYVLRLTRLNTVLPMAPDYASAVAMLVA